MPLGRFMPAVPPDMSAPGSRVGYLLAALQVLPWYTSSWSIETMKAAFVSAVGLINQMHAQFYADGAAAVAAFEATCRQSCGRSTTVVGQPAAAQSSGQSANSAEAAPASASAAADIDDAAAAAAAAAAEIAAAVCKATAAVAAKGPASCPVQVTPAVLQSLVARPLVAVQASLLMDTVAWQRGVLATPPVSACRRCVCADMVVASGGTTTMQGTSQNQRRLVATSSPLPPVHTLV